MKSQWKPNENAMKTESKFSESIESLHKLRGPTESTIMDQKSDASASRNHRMCPWHGLRRIHRKRVRGQGNQPRATAGLTGVLPEQGCPSGGGLRVARAPRPVFERLLRETAHR